MFRRAALFAMTALALLGCSGPHSHLEDRVFTGRTVTQVRSELGEPDKIDHVTKTTDNINGPMEKFWDEVKMDGTVDVWTYNVDYGRKEVYFLPGRIDAVGEFFWFNDTSKNPVF